MGSTFRAIPLPIFLVVMIIGGMVVEGVPGAQSPPLSCGTVTLTLAPCFEYVLGGGVVPRNCCSGVITLYKTANTTPARRTVCNCLKGITRTASRNAVENAKVLPKKCGVIIPYEISPTIDCNKVF